MKAKIAASSSSQCRTSRFQYSLIRFVAVVVVTVVTVLCGSGCGVFGVEEDKTTNHRGGGSGVQRKLLEQSRRIQYTNTDGLQCENMYGNPCGPDSVCTDIDNGYVCDHPNLYGCPSGCNLNSYCTSNPTLHYGLYYCQCHDGYIRIREDLPCVTQDHVDSFMDHISSNQMTIETYNEIETTTTTEESNDTMTSESV